MPAVIGEIAVAIHEEGREGIEVVAGILGVLDTAARLGIHVRGFDLKPLVQMAVQGQEHSLIVALCGWQIGDFESRAVALARIDGWVWDVLSASVLEDVIGPLVDIGKLHCSLIEDLALKSDGVLGSGHRLQAGLDDLRGGIELVELEVAQRIATKRVVLEIAGRAERAARRTGGCARKKDRAWSIQENRCIVSARKGRQGKPVRRHEDAVAAAQHRLSVAGEVDRKAEARLKRMLIGDLHAGVVLELDLVVAQAELEGDRRQWLPGILQKDGVEDAREMREVERLLEQQDGIWIDRPVEVLVESTAGEVVLREKAHVALAGAELEFVAAKSLVDEIGETGLQLVAVALRELGVEVVVRRNAGQLVGNPWGVEIARLRKLVYRATLDAALELEEKLRAWRPGHLRLVD